ncbi:hypothetical protein RUESEDTHA_03518 [Ruegeria sp. THAF57]|nr:hypothetical protein RUESEDTHA_03518 [Ruegeria sp. THAF57]
MMQTRTSFAIILPKITCFLHLGLSGVPEAASVGAKEASVKKQTAGTSWNEVGTEPTGPV